MRIPTTEQLIAAQWLGSEPEKQKVTLRRSIIYTFPQGVSLWQRFTTNINGHVLAK